MKNLHCKIDLFLDDDGDGDEDEMAYEKMEDGDEHDVVWRY